ncbi:hypothetical protein [Halopelagius fulvigenes]|uniref:PGF-CTERM sorting domain-containing protein n=1 Tax=Halopelagius fulvigenes TaxID=1198324 RepID=A0ABD5TTQ9_9EURY
MTTEPRADASDAGESSGTFSRRRLLRGVVTAGAAASLPAFVGGASAQEGTVTTDNSPTEPPTEFPTEESGTSAPEEEVAAEAALPTDAPTFGQSDYTGLFLQVTGYDREADTSGAGRCGFAESNEDITGFDATIFETTGDRRSAQTTIFAVTQGSIIDSGSVFVINSQNPCPSNFVTVTLEEVGATGIETPTPQGTTSGGAIPGFDAVAGVLGVGAAAAAAAVRARGDE